MASATEKNDPDINPRGPTAASAPVETADAKPSFFRVYKKGQGYWTRLSTNIAVTTIGFLLGLFLYTNLRSAPVGILLGVLSGYAIGYAFVAWSLLNRPGNVQFLIETDTEMRKVNWATRKELIGSTKVVILFTFIISALIAVMDFLFVILGRLIGILWT